MMYYYPPFSPFYRRYSPSSMSKYENKLYSSEVGKNNPQRIYNQFSNNPQFCSNLSKFSSEKNCYSQTSLCEKNTNSHIENITAKEEKKIGHEDNPIFEIFGIKLYFDDILILSLLFFLYSEGVQDKELFLALILLLFS